MRKQIYSAVAVMLLSSAAMAQPAGQKSFVINGQVLDGEGRPVAGAEVLAAPDALRGRMPKSASDQLGKFTIEVFQTGRFMLTAEKFAEGYPSSYNPFYHVSPESRPQVLVAEGGEAHFTTIRFAPRAGKIAGRIVDGETGRPVETVQVKLCRTEAPNYCYRSSAKYPGGLFQSLVPASAPFVIQMSAPGYQDWSETAAVTVASGATKEISVSMVKLASGADKSSNLERLSAPELLFPADGTEFYHFPRTTRLEWSAVPGAVSYTLELEVCAWDNAGGKDCKTPHPFQHPRNPPTSEIRGFNYEFMFVGAQPGRWRVWAVDAEGRAGAKSAWATFVYRQ
jgi:hypothetical protein